MSVHPWIPLFLEAQSAELGASENTLIAYASDLKSFEKWVSAQGKSLETADQKDVTSYLVSCDAEGLAPATRARRLSTIRQLYRFAFEDRLRADNPALRIKGPGRSRTLPRTLSEGEVDRLLEAARNQGRSPGDRIRNTCLMELLYATGMRVSELVSLPTAATRGDPRILMIRGKGGKERMVPLSPPARVALAEWLVQRDAAQDAAREKGQPPSPFLFPSSGRLGHLTRHRFYVLIKDLAVAAGVSPQKVTPHTLRHAFATHLLANGADLRSIQTLLGHADVATTEIYTHVLEERLKSLVMTRHPLADDADRRSAQGNTSSDGQKPVSSARS